MLTKQEVLNKAKELYLIDESKRIILKIMDYKNNPVAPECTAYRLHFTDVFGTRKKVTYYPNTLGFQG